MQSFFRNFEVSPVASLRTPIDQEFSLRIYKSRTTRLWRFAPSRCRQVQSGFSTSTANLETNDDFGKAVSGGERNDSVSQQA
jgi:hypothetical protein